MSEGRLRVKVYYEDTDSLGVVYYANYLKYYERGRTEFINEQGKDILEWNKSGYNYAVFKMDITWLKAVRLSDELDVLTKVVPSSPYRMKMKQKLMRGNDVVNEANVQLVCLDEKMELREFPPELLALAVDE